jgi:2-polyprenyl-6-methoxyphenol hydroxylase-like FAD-dependent oxidoreductase
MGQRGAVVLGASMGGLLAARALSNHFERVTVVERDHLAEAEQVRKGVPQSAHAHGLLASGYAVMDEYFPGLMDELEERGAPRGDVIGDFLWFQYGRWKLRHPSGLRGITVSRPCLETAVRHRVRLLPNVSFREGLNGVRPRFDPGEGRVTGLVVRRGDKGFDESIDADLVVDASGRGSQSPRWLEELGFERCEEISVKVDVGYTTRVFERKPGEFFDSMGGIISATPESARIGAVLAAEDDRWVVTLGGNRGDYPPTDEKDFAAFAASLPVPAVHDLVTSARPLTDFAIFRFPANLRRFYERMKRFPAGYLVIGDAICSFNPIYGQGMSVAAIEAKALDDTLGSGVNGLAERFYARARKLVDIPWAIATSEDFRFPEVEGRRPPGFRSVSRYFDRVHAVASADPKVCRRFFDVLNLLAPPSSLMTPPVAWRVLTRPVPDGAGTPWGLLRR